MNSSLSNKRYPAPAPAHHLGRVLLLMAAGLAAASLALPVRSAPADISQTPLITASGTPIKPNLLFVLDDSGSMNDDALPEAVNSLSSSAYGMRSSQCNGLAYNAKKDVDGKYEVSYDPPLDDLGNSKGNADPAIAGVSFAIANRRSLSDIVSVVTSGDISVGVNASNPMDDWYKAGELVTLYSGTATTQWMLGKVKSWNTTSKILVVTVSEASVGSGTLNTPRVSKGQPSNYYYTYLASPSLKPLSYSYSSTGVLVKDSNFFKQCASVVGATPGKEVFTRVNVKVDEAQRWANWYTYYRTRMLMMKTVVSHAFKNVDSRYRVGFNTILNTGITETDTNTAFLNVRDFDSNQKKKFYDSLFATTPGGYTPLRGAIMQAGRYFAKKASTSQSYDPMQFSCQQNFMLLATDGAWNTNNEIDKVYGPYQLTTGDKVGQQDGSANFPMKDGTGSSAAASSDSLADVAMYYYMTDLRTDALKNCTGASRPDGSAGGDVCLNDEANKGKGRDTATWQRMVSHALNLGQNGTLPYEKNYEANATVGGTTFYKLSTGALRWPTPVNEPTKVDDLWHAAVNGRGTYFNASDASQVTEGLTTVLNELQALLGKSSAAATSTLRPVEGNNQVFIARYRAGKWIGDVRAYKLDPYTGRPKVITDPKDLSGDTDNADWSAATKLAARSTPRKILFRGQSGTLTDFSYDNMSSDQQKLFSERCSTAPLLGQCAALTVDEKTALGSNLVLYLKGQAFPVRMFRERASTLGDMVGSSPVYVGLAPLLYKDAGYSEFSKSDAVTKRRPMVYVGANDGMLHAFDAVTGEEMWAFVPTAVLPNLHKLADLDYGSKHQFFVDGAPVVADVHDGSKWRTLLITGLGAGGAGYFALDVTSPEKPELMWEFDDAKVPGMLGLAMGQPLVTKYGAGNKWVVALTSGYNNSDGMGRLFIRDAITGDAIKTMAISTAFDSTLPTGMGPANAWVESSDDNKALRFYAGDMQGRVWRFDPSESQGFLLAQLKAGGKVQPISTQPQLALINYKGFKTPVVYVGTGRLLGGADMTDTSQQSVYGLKDDLSAASMGDVRGGGSLVQQTLTTEGSTRTASGNPVDWSTKNGWFVDLPTEGERVNIDMLLQFNTLTAVGNIPKTAAVCGKGVGQAWLYYFDIASGGNTDSDVATLISDAMVVGLSAFVLGEGKNGVIINKSDKDPEAKILPTPSLKGLKARRTSWRELVDR